MRVIITGAAGRIGREIIDELSESHQLCLIDRIPVKGRASRVADLARHVERSRWRYWFGFKSRGWTQMSEGVNVVLHLAGEPNPTAVWQKVLDDNIQATWNVANAAARHGASRVVFASSIHTAKALLRELAPACYASSGPKIGSDAPPQPLTPYGLSKAIGEQIGCMAVDEDRLASFIVDGLCLAA